MGSDGNADTWDEQEGGPEGGAELLHAGAIPFRRGDEGWEFLLVTSKKGNWIFPKGLVEYGDSVEDTALRECQEEAGVRGKLLPDEIGTYADRKWQHPCKVLMYLLAYEGDVPWDESDIRRRRWCNLEIALSQLNKQDLKDILLRAAGRIEKLDADQQL